MPTPAMALTGSQLHVKHLIRHYFPAHWRSAQAVAWCESRYDAHAQNGQYEGVYQLSASWRSYFRARTRWHDVAFTASENIRAARRIWLSQGWTPWSCAP